MSSKRGKPEDNWGDGIKTIVREYAESLIIAVLLALVVRWYVLSAYQIPTSSMEPTLIAGDLVLGYKLPFGVPIPFSKKKWGRTPPQRGEILIFQCPETPRQLCIKRVVALSGDRIEMEENRLIVNGKTAHYKELASFGAGRKVLLEEILGKKHAVLQTQEKGPSIPPTIVPPGHVFVLGDSRNHSLDSRQWGPVPYENIEARPLFIWMSFDWGQPQSEDFFPEIRWKRIFRRVE